MPTPQEVLDSAVDFHQRGDPSTAYNLLVQLLNAGVQQAGLRHFQAVLLIELEHYDEAYAAAQMELQQTPGHEGAKLLMGNLTHYFQDRQMRQQPARTWQSSLPGGNMMILEAASHAYTYRGISLVKTPFDLALYPLLLWDVKPRTIIEIGSWNGGSALWMADQLDNFGIDGEIYSIDIKKVQDVSHRRVTFMEGNGRDLAQALSAAFLAALPRPLLVIEDADHMYETTLHVLRFFDQVMHPGEYIVVEDGMSRIGPRKAVEQFLGQRPGRYTVDGKYCDFFGYNTTWSINGYLRRSDAT